MYRFRIYVILLSCTCLPYTYHTYIVIYPLICPDFCHIFRPLITILSLPPLFIPFLHLFFIPFHPSSLHLTLPPSSLPFSHSSHSSYPPTLPLSQAVDNDQNTNQRGHVSVMMHELRIAYELLLDAKRHKQRIADVVLALQDCSRTPPAPGSSPRILGEPLLSPFLSPSLSSSNFLSFFFFFFLFFLFLPLSTSLLLYFFYTSFLLCSSIFVILLLLVYLCTDCVIFLTSPILSLHPHNTPDSTCIYYTQ